MGATVLGGVLNISLAHGSSGQGAIDFDQIRRLLDHTGDAIGDAAVRVGLDQSLHYTFLAVFAITVLTLLLATLVPSAAVTAKPRELVAE